MIRFLSPTSVALYWKDRGEFYMKYMSDNPPPRMPQTQPMAVGSAFDARVKSYLCKEVLGGGWSYDELFEAQVDPQNRDFARVEGEKAFQLYVQVGALADLMVELAVAQELRMELTVEGTVSREMGATCSVPLLGKPDLYYKVGGVGRVIDWKVNGWCSKSRTSPAPGYKKLLPGGKMHKDYLGVFGHEGWMQQLSIYSWLLGEPVGTDAVVGIDQIVGRERVAIHRGRISAEWQHRWWEQIVEVWDYVNRNEREEGLENYGKMFEGDTGKFLAGMVRRHRDW